MDISSFYDLKGKVAVVTGGGDGIGKACSELLAAAGASVVVSDLNVAKAQAVADGIARNGGSATGVGCNVADPEDLQKLVDAAVDKFGTVNILVNNAGIGGGGRENPFNIDENYIERVYRINVFAPLLLCKLTVPLIRRQKQIHPGKAGTVQCIVDPSGSLLDFLRLVCCNPRRHMNRCSLECVFFRIIKKTCSTK